MINKIHIENIATYISGIEFEPKKINFIYGSNGTGKSTLARVLNNELFSHKSAITWDRGNRENVVVYNRSFVEKNFLSDKNLKGIFTLGEESIEVQREIDEKRAKINEAEGKKIIAQGTIDQLTNKQNELRAEIEEKCWCVQKQYGSEFEKALVGYRGKIKTFCEKCLEVYDTIDLESISSVEELKTEYDAAFNKSLVKGNKYQSLPISDVLSLDTNELLNTVISGKSDTQIGTFIEYLHASDWVKTGIDYAKKTSGKCPYCQQALPTTIQKEIEEYFDKKFEENKNTLLAYEEKYIKMVNQIKKLLLEVDSNKYSNIDYTEFDNKKTLLILKLEKNQQTIRHKINFLSDTVEIETVYYLASDIENLIKAFNYKIEITNRIIENQEKAQIEFTKKLWNFLIFKSYEDIRSFTKKNNGLETGKNCLKQSKSQQEEIIKKLTSEIEEQERLLTSVRPTVDAINGLLKNFGFNGFLLDINEEKIGTYKIVRPTGEDASKTLSDGEHNFISFLYFYYLCFGSQEKTGLDSPKVLIVDDPISSMDSNVLFIVSTLVKKIIRHCLDNEKGINQVFLLTHNVYFHKEITFLGSRKEFPDTKARFYVLRKNNGDTTIEEYLKNPIKTSYELLWKELKTNTTSSANMLMNVMRRILEYYFTVIGGIKYEECIDKINGTDKIVCKSLISFINDGSHSVFEDFIFTPDDNDVENYKKVFKLVFKVMGHIDHYNMMMNREYD